MTKMEKEAETKARLKVQLKQKVRVNRPAEKVLELAIALAEDRVDIMADQKARMERELEYMRELDPKEIEPEAKES